MSNELLELLELLKNLQDNGPDEPVFGICSQSGFSGHHFALVEGFKAWPEFSGSDAYPVPSESWRTPADAYDRAGEDQMWNPDHEYGAARLRLVDWLVNYFEGKENATA